MKKIVINFALRFSSILFLVCFFGFFILTTAIAENTTGSIVIEDSIDFTITGAGLGNDKIDFVLEYYENPNDPDNLYWKLDFDSLKLSEPIQQLLKISDLAGKYRLVSFEIKYDGGITITDQNIDVNYSGTFNIYESGYGEQLMIFGYQTVQGSGYFELIDNNTLRVQSAGYNYDMYIEFDGVYLTTYIPSGVVGNYSERNTWQIIEETSNTHQQSAESSVNTINNYPLGLFFGQKFNVKILY